MSSPRVSIQAMSLSFRKKSSARSLFWQKSANGRPNCLPRLPSQQQLQGVF